MRKKAQWSKKQKAAIAFYNCGRERDAVIHWTKGWAGEGWYVWCSTYPDEGAVFLGRRKYGRAA